MGGGGSTTTNTQSRAIPGLLRPYIKDLLTRGQAASKQVSADPYTGGFVAPATDAERLAAGQSAQIGQNLGTNSGQSLINLGQQQASGYFLDPATNKYLQPMIDTSNNAIYRNYADQSNRAASSSIQGGAFGGTRAQLGQSQLATDTNRLIGENTNNLLYTNYAAERANQQNSGALIQQGAGLNLLGPEILQQSGADTRALNQISLDEALAQFNENNAAPFRPLEPYANLIYGGSGSFSAGANQAKTNPGGSTWGSIVGDLLGVAGIGAGLL